MVRYLCINPQLHLENLTFYALLEGICRAIIFLYYIDSERMYCMDIETKEILQLILKGQEELKLEVSGLKQEVSGIKQDIQSINIKLENTIEPKLQLIYENQVNIINQNKELELQNIRIRNLETDVSALKYAFKALKQSQ